MALEYDPTLAFDPEPEAEIVTPEPRAGTREVVPPPANLPADREPIYEEPGADKLEPVTPRVTPQPRGPMAYDPTLTFDRERLPDQPDKPKEDEDYVGSDFMRGLRVGVGHAPQSFAGLAQVGAEALGEDTVVGKGLTWVKDGLLAMGQYIDENEQLKVPSFTDIGKTGNYVSDFMTYLAENSGQMLGSSSIQVAGAAAGAVVGGVAGGVPTAGVGVLPGAVAGATMGSRMASVGAGIGDMRQALDQDPEIQQALKDGRITKYDLATYSTIPGMAMGALDAVSFERGLKTIKGGVAGAKEAAKAGIKAYVVNFIKDRVKAGVKIGGTEGATEAVQQAIQEFGEVYAGGDKNAGQSLLNVFNSGAAGFFGGLSLGGATGSGKGKSTTKAPGSTGTEGTEEVPAEVPATTTGPGTGQGAPPAQPGGAGTTGGEDATKPEVQRHIGTSTPMQERIAQLRQENPGWTLGRAFTEAQRERTERERATPGGATSPQVDPDIGAAAAETAGAAPNEFGTRAEAPGAPPVGGGMTEEQTAADELGMTVEEYRAMEAQIAAKEASGPTINVAPTHVPGASSPATPSTAAPVSDAAVKPDPVAAAAKEEEDAKLRREQAATNTETVRAGLAEEAAIKAAIEPTPAPEAVRTEAPAPPSSPTGEVEAPAAPPRADEQPGAPDYNEGRRGAEIAAQEEQAFRERQAADAAEIAAAEQRAGQWNEVSETGLGPTPAEWKTAPLEPTPPTPAAEPVVREAASPEAVPPAAEGEVSGTPAPARESTLAPQVRHEPAPTPAHATPKVAALVTKAKGKAEPIMTPRKARETIAGFRQAIAAGKLSPEKKADYERRIAELEEKYGRKETPTPEAKEEPVTPRVTKAEEKAGPKGRAVLGLKTKVEVKPEVKEKPKPIPAKVTETVEAAPRPTEQKKEEHVETAEERRERIRLEEHAHREAIAEEAAKEHVAAMEKKRAEEKARKEGTLPGEEKKKDKITAKKVAEGGVTSGMIKGRERENIEDLALRLKNKLGEKAPVFVDRILDLKQSRKKWAHGGGKRMQRERDKINAEINKVINDWIASLEAQENAPTAEEQEAARQEEIRKTAEEIAAGEKDKYVTEIEREQAEKEAAAKGYAGENAAAKEAVDQHFAPAFNEMEKSGNWDPAKLVAAVKKAAAAFKGELSADMERLGAPWMNFLVYAQRKGTTFPDMFAAYTWVRDGLNEEFYSHAMQPAEFGQTTETQVAKKEAVKSKKGGAVVEEEKDERDVLFDDPEAEVEDSDMVAPTDIESWLETTEEPGKGQVLSAKRADGTTFSYQLREKQSHTAGSLLKSLPLPASWMESALVRAIDKRVRQELTRLVGNVPVYVVPGHVINSLRGHTDGRQTNGVYMAPTHAQRAAGHRGSILIAEEITRNPARYAHVLKHEMVHGAVNFAYETNYKNSKEIFDQLYHEAATTGLLTGRIKAGEYALTNAMEFMAEAMTNGSFQERLARMEASENLAAGIRGLPVRRGFLTSMWQKFVAQVSRIIGANVYGNAGISYTEATLTLFGATAQEKVEMQAWAERQRGTAGFTSPRSRISINGNLAGAPDTDAKTKTTDDIAGEIFDAPLVSDTIKDGAARLNEFFDGAGSKGWLRKRRYQLLSGTKDMRNLVSDMFNDKIAANPLVKAMNAHLGRDALRSKLAEAGNTVANKLMAFREKHKKEADAIEAWFDQATRSGADPRYDFAHFSNKHIAIDNFRTRWKRKQNAKLHAAYSKFSPEAKALIDEAVTAYKEMHKAAAEETVEKVIEGAIAGKHLFTLPPGETARSVTLWVTSGEIDKPPSAQTARDQALHKALDTASATGIGGQLKRNPSMRVVEGLYVPLMRRGKYVVRATKDWRKTVPAGAISVDENSFVFHKESDFNDFMNKNPDLQISTRGHKNRIRVTVQNRNVQFFDNLTEANRVAAELKKAGLYDEVKQAEWANEDIDREKNLEILPAQTQALIRSVRQLQNMTDTARNAAEQAITNAALQHMAGNQMQHRYMQRTGVLGNSMDMVLAMRDYTGANSMYRANLRTSPAIKAGIEWANDWIDKHPGVEANRLREILTDFERRINSTSQNRDYSILRTIATLSFVNHLASFSYLGLQTTQPFYSTLPELMQKTSFVKANAALLAAYGKIGIKGLGTETITDFGKAFTRKRAEAFDHAKAMLAAVKGKPEEDVLNGLVDRGLLDENAGLEMDLRSAGRGTGVWHSLEKAGDYMARPLRALTSGIEAVNRGASGIAAYNIGIDTGMTHAEAVEYAIRVVEDTQGNYSAANSPSWMSSPLGKVLGQFKKYPLMIISNLTRKIGIVYRQGLKTKEGREAFRGLVSTLLIYAALSGASGALPWEVINLLLFGLKGIGVDWSKDKFHSWLAGVTGKNAAEVLMGGLPRMLGMDVSNRISLGSLLTFGEPKDTDPDSIYAYLGKTLGGPIVGMMIDGVFGDGLDKLPMPKIVRDMAKAYEGATVGRKSPAGIKQAEPYSVRDTIIKGLGFSTSKEARRFEPGGIFYEKTQEKKRGEDRSALINAAANADKDDFADAWEDIKDWNRSHKGKERIDRGDIYKRKQLHRKQERKERKQGWIE